MEGEDPVAALRACQENEARLRGLLSLALVKEEETDKLRDENALLTMQVGQLRSQLSQLQERTKAKEEEMVAEVAENESEITWLQKENEKLSTQLKDARASLQQLSLQHQQQQQQRGKEDSTASFQAVSKEQLRGELLNAAVTAERLEGRIRQLEETNEKLEKTVQVLFRQNQDLTDEVMVLKENGNTTNNNNTMNESLNTSLADELDFSEPSTPVKGGGMFSDMSVVVSPMAPPPTPISPILPLKQSKTASAPLPAKGAPDSAAAASKNAPVPLFSDMEVINKERNDRQYRDFVYMSLSAIKIAMTIKELASSEVLLKLSAKRVYAKALERRVPLHQVYDFVRKYTVAYVEHMSAPREPQRPQPQLGLLGRVLTTYFPSTDYLFRTAEVVPNRGSELGSFLYKRGALWSRAWKHRWFKLNSQLGVVSYHPDPHVLNSLGTIPIEEINTVAAVPGGIAPYEHVFRITTQWGREYDLAADSAIMMNYWLDGLTEAIAQKHIANADKRQSKTLL